MTDEELIIRLKNCNPFCCRHLIDELEKRLKELREIEAMYEGLCK
jgi:hypothetical protein